jgi:hypothetical protein
LEYGFIQEESTRWICKFC